MTDMIESGQDITLTGKSGQQYNGKIYSDKNSTSAITGGAIACLSNSTFSEDGWIHQINSIYNVEDITKELAHFRDRDDISHLILLPYSWNEGGEGIDKVDDLIRSYVHS